MAASPIRSDADCPAGKLSFFSVLDMFLHPDLKSEANHQIWLARFLVLVTLITQLTFWRPALMYVQGDLDSLPTVVIAIAAAMLLVLVLVVLRTRGDFRLCAHLFLTAQLAALGSINLLSGGVSTAAIVTSVAMISIAIILRGGRAGAIWAVAITIQQLISFQLLKYGFDLPIDLPRAVIIQNQTSGTALGMLILIAANLVHEKLRASAVEDLTNAKDEAEKALQAKGEFLAIMSHEIRTPMNGVLGMSELLFASGLNEAQQQRCQMIQSSGTALLRIIDDILDLSKIEAGKMELEEVAFDLQALLSDTASIFALTAEKKNIGLVCSMVPGTPALIYGDPTRLRQILMNLIGNAFKFTSAGNVSIRASLDETAPDGSHLLRFEVRDTGIGIRNENLGKLLQSFSQADSSTTREHGGTGLGLAISKHLAQLMGGEVGVESIWGEGSCFWFSARLRIAEEGALPPVYANSKLAGKHLLVVDDNVAYVDTLLEQAKHWGMVVSSAYDGEAALAILRSSLEEGMQPVDLISLDMEMPGMNGLETAQAISADPALAKIPRLLLTATRTRIPADELAAAGLSLTFTKPLALSHLQRRYAQLLGFEQDETRLRPSKLDGRPQFEALHVLIAEDHEVNRMVVSGILRKLGVSYETANDGAVAVDLVCREGARFNLVLMGCEMPVLDGFDATLQIRAFERDSGRKPTPIIALSAHVMEATRDKTIEVGMNGYLSKPIILDELIELLDGLAMSS
jgi:signal transduction histidine kinase/CheY-like chemotaxis protein